MEINMDVPKAIIIVLLALCFTLAYYLYQCTYKDNYTAPYSEDSGIGICSGLDRQIYQNRADVKKDYNDAKLTEYSKFKQPDLNQKMYNKVL